MAPLTGGNSKENAKNDGFPMKNRLIFRKGKTARGGVEFWSGYFGSYLWEKDWARDARS